MLDVKTKWSCNMIKAQCNCNWRHTQVAAPYGGVRKINGLKNSCAEHTSDHRNTNTRPLMLNPANQDLRGEFAERYGSACSNWIEDHFGIWAEGPAAVSRSTDSGARSDTIASTFQHFLCMRQTNQMSRGESCPSFKSCVPKPTLNQH